MRSIGTLLSHKRQQYQITERESPGLVGNPAGEFACELLRDGGQKGADKVRGGFDFTRQFFIESRLQGEHLAICGEIVELREVLLFITDVGEVIEKPFDQRPTADIVWCRDHQSAALL